MGEAPWWSHSAASRPSRAQANPAQAQKALEHKAFEHKAFEHKAFEHKAFEHKLRCMVHGAWWLRGIEHRGVIRRAALCSGLYVTGAEQR